MKETPDMEGCDAFELAIEMRLHGALPAEQEPALKAHLAGVSGPS